MGDVIKFPGNFIQQEQDKKSVDTNDGRLDLVKFSYLQDFLRGLIKSSGRLVSAKTTETYHRLCVKHTDSQIIELINNSNEEDWQNKPGFYKVLCDLCHTKNLIR